jgi:hypothetical protein
LLLDFEGLHPQIVQVDGSEANRLQAHKGDVRGKCQISIDELGKLSQASHRVAMEDDTDLNGNPVTRQVLETDQGFVESSCALDDVIVLRIEIGVERDPASRPSRNSARFRAATRAGAG